MKTRPWLALLPAGLCLLLLPACNQVDKNSGVASPSENTQLAKPTGEPNAPAVVANNETTGTANAAATLPNQAGKKTIGLVIAGYQAPYYVPLVDAAKAQAAAQGDELLVFDSAYDNKKEADHVRTLISRKVDVAIVSPIDRNAVVPSLRALHEAGIPTIDLCNRQAPEGDGFVTVFLGVDPLEQGMRAGQALRKLLNDKGDVLLVEGFPGSPGQILRTEGFTKAISGSEIKIIGKNTGDWTRAKAMTVMEDFLTRFPKIDGVFTHDDSMAIGAIQAIKAAGRLGQFPVVSVGGNKDGLVAIRNGELTYTYQERPDWEGKHSILVADQIARGKLDQWIKQFKDATIVPENKLIWVKTPGADITKENVDRFTASW